MDCVPQGSLSIGKRIGLKIDKSYHGVLWVWAQGGESVPGSGREGEKRTGFEDRGIGRVTSSKDRTSESKARQE